MEVDTDRVWSKRFKTPISVLTGEMSSLYIKEWGWLSVFWHSLAPTETVHSQTESLTVINEAKSICNPEAMQARVKSSPSKKHTPFSDCYHRTFCSSYQALHPDHQ